MICNVPPVNTGPGVPVGPEASVQASKAPPVLALKVSPAPSKALPLEQMPPKNGESPTGRVATTVLVATLMTETVLFDVFITYARESSIGSDHYARSLRSYGDGGDHRIGDSVDDRNIVATLIGNVGACAVGSERYACRIDSPTGMMATTVLVATLMTETLPLVVLVT